MISTLVLITLSFLTPCSPLVFKLPISAKQSKSSITWFQLSFSACLVLYVLFLLIYSFLRLFVLKLDWRLSDEKVAEDSDELEKDPAYRNSVRCKVFLGFTSNLISSGVRDTIRYLVEHHMVSIHIDSVFLKFFGFYFHLLPCFIIT